MIFCIYVLTFKLVHLGWCDIFSWYPVGLLLWNSLSQQFIWLFWLTHPKEWKWFRRIFWSTLETKALAPPKWGGSLCSSDLSQVHHVTLATSDILSGFVAMTLFSRVYQDNMKVPSITEFPFKSTQTIVRGHVLKAEYFHWEISGGISAIHWGCLSEIVVFCLLPGCWFDCISKSVLVNPWLHLFFLAQPGAFPKIKICQQRLSSN